MKLNTFQSVVALTYANGEYAHLVDITEDSLNACGDTLFKFLMLELADDAPIGLVMNAEMAVQRMASALADVRHAFDVVVQVQQTKG